VHRSKGSYHAKRRKRHLNITVENSAIAASASLTVFRQAVSDSGAGVAAAGAWSTAGGNSGRSRTHNSKNRRRKASLIASTPTHASPFNGSFNGSFGGYGSGSGSGSGGSGSANTPMWLNECIASPMMVVLDSPLDVMQHVYSGGGASTGRAPGGGVPKGISPHQSNGYPSSSAGPSSAGPGGSARSRSQHPQQPPLAPPRSSCAGAQDRPNRPGSVMYAASLAFDFNEVVNHQFPSPQRSSRLVQKQRTPPFVGGACGANGKGGGGSGRSFHLSPDGDGSSSISGSSSSGSGRVFFPSSTTHSAATGYDWAQTK
jgi:hypothetical protein